MRLTTQMRAEILTMKARFEHLIESICPFFGGAISVEIKEIIDACILEMTGYKERVENLLCETDIKEQDHVWGGHTLDYTHWF